MISIFKKYGKYTKKPKNSELFLGLKFGKYKYY